MKRILPLLVLLCNSAFAQVNKGIEAITLNSSKAQITFLSSDLMKGRLAGTDENRIAAAYIFSALQELGYEPVYQPFENKSGEGLCNVLLKINGTDTTKNTVIGAHFDHLGIRNGEIYNGADDNASGTIAVLQMAKAIKASGLIPSKNMILAFWDGEESGLQGSRHFVSTFADVTKIESYMNFDMIGRNSDENNPHTLSFIYTKDYPQFEKWLRMAIGEHSLTLKPNFNAVDKPFSGSDNVPFARAGVPICWFHTEGHPDYHKPTDTVEKINWSKMMDIIRASYVVAWEMANN